MEILRGMFVIEGIDGSGKTTIGQALARSIPGGEYTMQPSNGEQGQKIRRILRTQESVSSSEFLSLFIEDRKEHQIYLEDQIKNHHKTIILDRYVLSTLAYQGLHFSLEELWEKNREFFIPQKTFFLDTPVDRAFFRKTQQIQQQGNEFEFFEKKEIQVQIAQNYKKSIQFLLEKGYPIVVLDGNQDVDVLVKECLEQIQETTI